MIDPHWAAELARRLKPEDLERDDLRTARAGQAASKVAALPEVRAALLAFQKKFARRDGGAVLDGRDIGTVICPEAEAKLYVTASDEVRAERRRAELGAANLAPVLADLRARDARDAGRDAGADGGGGGCALARHHGFVYRRGRRRGRCLREKPIPSGRGVSPRPRRFGFFGETLKDRRSQPPGPKHDNWRTECQLRQQWMISRRS